MIKYACSFARNLGSKHYYCTVLMSIEIHNSVTSIGEFSFVDCDLKTIEAPISLKSYLDDPDFEDVKIIYY